ncbi:MAG: amidase, Asp-tRNAAsn/Glu-tRNAGln amidotransferase subunit [Frankiales bacterium]|nr:amidase, Asp-tRNAAsn/Glu-tRNAGln amidotransferase subunit [Frankiales bacterium]
MSWSGDAVGLVEAFRRGELSPTEAVQDVIDAVDRYNCVCHVDGDAALKAAADADVALPFGGVPIGVKELEFVAGWPARSASLLKADAIAPLTSVHVERLRDRGGAIPVVQTTASEFGVVGYTSSRLHGSTTNPWDTSRTPGGSSGGSAAAVAGGIVPIATATDGGGSIRIPAAWNGLVGMKTSFRRIPFAPMAQLEPLTFALGCVSRSVRDTARWLDVASGEHPRDPFSLPGRTNFEEMLGRSDLNGLRAAVCVDFGGAVVHPDVRRVVEETAEALIREAGMVQLDVPLSIPDLTDAYITPSLPGIWAGVGAAYPDIKGFLTDEVAQLVDEASAYDREAAARVDPLRMSLNEHLADVFDQVDIVLSATCPIDPHVAAGPAWSEVDGTPVNRVNAGRLTMAMNISGLPAISIPAGLSPSGLPVGLQVVAMRHRDQLLLDIARFIEQLRPWPLLAPTAGLSAPTSG